MEHLLEVKVTIRGRQVDIHLFRQRAIRIGRNPKADICLDNVGISWEHARIERVDDRRYVIKDLRSQNGTLVNGERIRKAPLRPGDTVGLGKFLLTVDLRPAKHRDDDGTIGGTTDIHVAPTEGTVAMTWEEIERAQLKARKTPSTASAMQVRLPTEIVGPSKNATTANQLQGRWGAFILTFVLGVATGVLMLKCVS